MGWFEASILFVAGLITIAVILPVAAELIPAMKETMGNTVVLMVSMTFVIILAVAFILYIRQAREPDQYMGTGTGGFQ